jgi:adenylate cyclase
LQGIFPLAEYQRRLVPLIRSHGGSIDKFLGDGILASFGAALPTNTYARDALLAVGELVAASDAWNAERRACGETPIEVVMAVAAGDIVFGAIGDSTRLELTIIGAPVNLAAKLEKHCRAENARALTTADAMALARRQGFDGAIVEARPARAVHGVEHPVDVIVLAV